MLKRVFVISLVLVFGLLFVACGNESTSTDNSATPTQKEDPNAIELSVDNYSKYLNVSELIYCNSSPFEGGHAVAVGGYGVKVPGGSALYLGDQFDCIARVSGASTNFNYNDVIIRFKCFGSYEELNDLKGTSNGRKAFDCEVVVECNIAGEGKAKETIIMPSGKYTHESYIDSLWEVVSVSGNITPS